MGPNYGTVQRILQGHSLRRTHPRHSGVGKDPPIQELHNIERSSKDIIAFVQAVSPWNWDFCSLESGEHFIFPFN